LNARERTGRVEARRVRGIHRSKQRTRRGYVRATFDMDAIGGIIEVMATLAGHAETSRIFRCG
jgi:hypothetical protein